MVEVFFPIIARHAIGRLNSTASKLVAAIGAFHRQLNQGCYPFVWTKTTDKTLPYARLADSDARH